MYKLLIAGLSIITSIPTWACPSGTIAQGLDGNGQTICVVANASPGSSGAGSSPPAGSGASMVASPASPGHGVPIPAYAFKAQCLASLADLASGKLQAQLLKDKAVTSQVLAEAKVGEGQLGSSCNRVCDDYAFVSNKISWAHVSPGFLSEPEHTQQMAFKLLSQPPLPGKAEMEKCLPLQITMNWCPPSGTGVGAGPSRIENPLDKIKVCVTGGDALKSMNFSEADAAHNCARPSIVDAAERIKAEQVCVNQSVLADSAKAMAAQAATNKAAEEKAAARAAATAVARSPNATMRLAPAVSKKP